MATTLTCYGGVREIGGNKILLEDGQRRFLFDFGKAFGRYNAYFDGVFIKERSTRGLLDPISLGLIPPLRGVLRDDLVPVFDAAHLRTVIFPPRGRGRKPREKVEALPEAADEFWRTWQVRLPGSFRDLRRDHAPAVDLILLSHAHQDHISDLEYVSADIPAGSTSLTAFISKVLLDVGGAGKSGAPFANPHLPSAGGMLAADATQPYLARAWWFLDRVPEGKVSEDPLDNAASFWSRPASKSLEPRLWTGFERSRVRFWPLDHSLLGACGYAVETEAGWVAYTGDIRFHGQNGRLSWTFAQGLAEMMPTVLLCEGSRLTTPNLTTEADVYENGLRAVREAAGGLVVADFAPRNVERLLTFVRIASETGRILLVQPKDAYLLRAMALGEPALLDLMQDPSVGLYADPKAQIRGWEESLRQRYEPRIFSPASVKEDPCGYILAFSLTDAADMVDLVYLRGGRIDGIYVFSNSQAYDDEQKVDLLRLWNWVQHIGLKMVGLQPARTGVGGEVLEVKPVPGYHASGHAGGDELVEFVRRVRPKTLVPIHTEVAERWIELLDGTGIHVHLPEYGRPIAVG